MDAGKEEGGGQAEGRTNSKYDQEFNVWSCLLQVPGTEGILHDTCLENASKGLCKRTLDPCCITL